VPVSKLYKTASGELADYFVIPAGTDVIFPIASINILPSVWGPDGEQFRAERWIEKDGLPEEVQNLSGGFVHTFTFISGPRACLGMRFGTLTGFCSPRVTPCIIDFCICLRKQLSRRSRF
ncbi:uncharacterized protein LAESUDRAFT_665798, partial [Laetiporus sulphureus 93-53]